VFRRAVDDVIAPVVERFAPDWLFISAGFDAHRNDPLAGLELTSADYADLAIRLQQLAPSRRTVVVLEGGYDFEALSLSTGLDPVGADRGGVPTRACFDRRRRSPDDRRRPPTVGPGLSSTVGARRDSGRRAIGPP
jgi:hypothetical protein